MFQRINFVVSFWKIVRPKLFARFLSQKSNFNEQPVSYLNYYKTYHFYVILYCSHLMRNIAISLIYSFFLLIYCHITNTFLTIFAPVTFECHAFMNVCGIMKLFQNFYFRMFQVSSNFVFQSSIFRSFGFNIDWLKSLSSSTVAQLNDCTTGMQSRDSGLPKSRDRGRNCPTLTRPGLTSYSGNLATLCINLQLQLFQIHCVNLVWRHFFRNTNGSKAKCKHCGTKLKTGGGSTKGLNTHMKTKHNEILARAPLVNEKVICDYTTISARQSEANQVSGPQTE